MWVHVHIRFNKFNDNQPVFCKKKNKNNNNDKFREFIINYIDLKKN